ncbi:DarT ssDNA thymidine ADP-ribosyltransferase family protein [Agromyces sp. SYSU T00266]|uniref:DarT ssDNA thymidine ADP-ribosyltransferase family protein n=1 Tax=Agromyces zhanjiangensis TaxID=3158562 RepID=UPI003396440E
MGEECIHGFDEGLCAICSPPPEPAAAPKPARATRTSAGRSTLRDGPAARSAKPAASARSSRASGASAAPVDVGKTRIYHVTHIENLGRILGAGAILADAGDPPATPAVDVAAPAARAYRRSATVPGADATVAEYVPFLLSTDAHLWDAIRTGTQDPRLAPEAVERAAADHVILVSSVAAAAGARRDIDGEVVVSATDAAVGGAELAADWSAVSRAIVRLTLADDGEGLRTGELLVRGDVPLERIALIAVSNDRVRDRVRAALQAVGAKTRVAVYPPWFLGSGD